MASLLTRRGLAALALAVGLCAGCEPAIPRPIGSLDDARVYPIGANFFLDREVEAWKRDQTVALARQGGIRWAKQQFAWEEIEPERGRFDWAKADQVVGVFETYGLHIIARLDRPPAWARRDNSVDQSPPDDIADYAGFVRAFVRHFAGRIHYLQIWNEPNAFPEWGPRAVDPAGYVALLRQAYAAAKAVDPTVKVLSAPLAMTLGQPHPEPGKWISMNDLDYLEAMYQAGARDYFDILGYNAFGFAFPPDDPPDPGRLNFQRVALARAVMEKYGDAGKAVWIDEYAWCAAPADMPASRLAWARQDEARQAEYTVRGYEIARRQWPWMGVLNIWYFRQPGAIPPDRADYYFRMVDPDFTPRAIYRQVQAYARQLQ